MTCSCAGLLGTWPYVVAILIALYAAAVLINELQGGQGVPGPTEGP